MSPCNTVPNLNAKYANNCYTIKAYWEKKAFNPIQGFLIWTVYMKCIVASSKVFSETPGQARYLIITYVFVPL